MYTTAVTKDDYEHRCIGSAVSKKPLGPFKPESKALVCPDKRGKVITNVIGGASFTDVTSKETRYLLYGERVLTPDEIDKTRIMAQPVSLDGLKIVDGQEPISLTVANEEEGFVNESPSIIYADGLYVLFYSTNAWYDPKYTISCATSYSMQKPFIKQKKPVLKTGMKALKGWTSPGSGTVLGADIEKTDGGGEKVKYVFHAAKPGTEKNNYKKIVRDLFTVEILVKDGVVRAV